MALQSRSGLTSQSRNKRLPMAVAVRSNTDKTVGRPCPDRGSPASNGCMSSRLRMVALSRCMVSPLQRGCRRQRCPREAEGWVSRKYRRTAPAAPIPTVRPRQPNPSSECTANCVWSSCEASSGLKKAEGRAQRRAPDRRARHDVALALESGYSTSRGSSLASSSIS